MSHEVHLALYYKKQQELFSQLARGNVLCRCNDCTRAFSALITPVWQRTNYVNKSTAHRHFDKMARHRDPEQRDCRYPDGGRKFFEATQVLEHMAKDLQLLLDSGPGSSSAATDSRAAPLLF